MLPLWNVWSVLECVQKSFCTLRLQLHIIDFQPSTTSTQPPDQDQSQQEASGRAVAECCYRNERRPYFIYDIL